VNPTGRYSGSASGKQRVNEFIRIMEEDFGIACTPRVRRGIDIDAGCGQLKSKALFEEELKAKQSESEKDRIDMAYAAPERAQIMSSPVEEETSFSFDFATIDLDSDQLEYNEDDEIIDETFDAHEASRLISLVQETVVKSSDLK